MEVNTLPIVRPDDHLRAFSWPALREVESPSIDKDSCLVVCAGFEDRAVHIIRRIQEAGISRPHVVMIAYLPYSEANRIEGLREFVARGGFRVTEITYNRQEPSGNWRDAARNCRFVWSCFVRHLGNVSAPYRAVDRSASRSVGAECECDLLRGSELRTDSDAGREGYGTAG